MPFAKESPLMNDDLQPTNPLAIAGVICGGTSVVFGWVCCCFYPVALAGLVLSIVALVQLSANPQQRGRNLAIAGIILSVLGPIVAIILSLVLNLAMVPLMERLKGL
jgi:uncharacterized membrane protein